MVTEWRNRKGSLGPSSYPGNHFLIRMARRGISLLFWMFLGIGIDVFFSLFWKEGWGGEPLTRDAFTPEVIHYLVRSARDSLASALHDGPPSSLEAPAPLRTAEGAVHLLLFLNGKTIAEGTSYEARTLLANLRVAASRTMEDLARRVLEEGKEQDVEKATLVITITLASLPTNSSSPPPFLRPALGHESFEAQFYGMSYFLPAWTPLLLREDWRATLLRMARFFAERADVDPKNTEQLLRKIILHPEFRLIRFPSAILVSSPSSPSPFLFFRTNPLVPMSEITAEGISSALDRALQWILRQEEEKKAFPMAYDPVLGISLGPAPLLDQILAAAAVGEAAVVKKDPLLRACAIRALSIALEAYREDPQRGIGYLREEGEIAIAPAAAAVSTVLILRAHEEDPAIAQKTKRLVAFLRYLSHPDGRFEAYLSPEGKRSKSNAFLSLVQNALLAWSEETNDGSLREQCSRAFRYYEGEAWKSLRERRFPSYEVFPFLSRSAGMLYKNDRQQAIVDFIFQTNRLLATAAQQNRKEQGVGIPEDEIGRFVLLRDPRSEDPPASFSATCVRSLAEAILLARSLGEEETAKTLYESMRRGLRYLLQLQFRDSWETFWFLEPNRVIGGFRTHGGDPTIRLETLHQAIPALLRALEVLEGKKKP